VILKLNYSLNLGFTLMLPLANSNASPHTNYLIKLLKSVVEFRGQFTCISGVKNSAALIQVNCPRNSTRPTIIQANEAQLTALRCLYALIFGVWPRDTVPSASGAL